LLAKGFAEEVFPAICLIQVKFQSLFKFSVGVLAYLLEVVGAL
jgi:hypothetical protein